MTKKEKKVEVNFEQEIVDVLKTYAKIGQRSAYESFVVIHDTKMKVVHNSGAIISTYEYESIGIDKPFAVFDANKLLKIIDSFTKAKKKFTFEFKGKHSLVIKSGKRKYSLYLVDFKEGKPDDSDLKDDKMVGYVMLSDELISDLCDNIEENKKAEFIMTNADIQKIKNDQNIMNVKDKFTIEAGNKGIKITITDNSTADSSDNSSFEITDGIKVNDLEDGDKINMCISLNFFIKDDYKVTIGSHILFEGIENKLNYIVAPDIDAEQQYNEGNNTIDDDFSDDFAD